MTMMISKFHKLIQSRILWGAFLIIIVFSFVIWGMIWPSDLEKAEQANAAGTLDGAPVSFGEFRSAYLSSLLKRALEESGREIPSTPEREAILRTRAWQRLATLREAAQLGIAATEEELVGAIRGNFSDTNGVYNRAYYQSFEQNLLRPLGFTVAHFEQHLREEIAIQKIAMLVGRQAHVTPLEIRRTFDTLLDEFTVEYAVVRPEDVETGVAVSEEDARALFDEDPAAFTVPEQREVSVAVFPLADFQDEDAEISEEAVLDYYEARIDDYTTTETGEDGQPRETVADVEDVRADIVKALRRAATLEKADEAAIELTSHAIPGRDGIVPDFAAEALKSGRATRKLAPFSRAELPLEDAGRAFTATAFDLEPNAYERVSAPVAGEENVYVIYLERVLAPRVPSFDEARERVLATAKRNAVTAAMIARAEALRKAATEGLAAGKTFKAALAGTGAQAETAEPFTGISGSSSTNEAVQALVQAVVSYNQGEVTEPTLSETGLIVAYLQARTPADPATFDAYQMEIASAIRERRAQGLFQDWQTGLLAPERFTDLQRPAASDEPEEDGGEETEEEPAETDEADAPADDAT